MSNIIRRNSYNPFFDLFDFPFESQNKNEVMKTDIEENEGAYKLSIEVPSVKKEDVKISLEDGYLNVSIEKKNENVEKDKKGKILHRERYYGSFKRAFYVGEDVKNKDISASLVDGVLGITINKPVKEENKEIKYIDIQ